MARDERGEPSRRLLLAFLAVTFGISWSLWGLEILTGRRLYLAPYGPTLGALAATYAMRGPAGLRDLLKRGVKARFAPAWWAVILLLAPGLNVVALALARALGEHVRLVSVPPSVGAALGGFVTMLVLGGPLAEEFGWRGVLQDELQRGTSVTNAAVLTGLVWGVWHLPLYFMPEQELYRQLPFVGFVFGAVGLSIVLAWIYNGTNRSVLAAILFHSANNYALVLFPWFENRVSALLSVVFTTVLAITLAVRMARARVPGAAG